MSLNMSDFVGMTCSLKLSNIRANKDFNSKQVLTCIRMGITVFKTFIWGGVSSDMWSEIMFYGSVKLNFQSYIELYTSHIKIFNTQLSPKCMQVSNKARL